ncbi:MAG: dioxygenase [Acidobacteriota bacterium]|nr:dioxygenase [Acidobacteriota bacterium]
MDPTTRLPTFFISHGGGPWPWIKELIPFDFGDLEESLQSIPGEVGDPTAVLCVTAHWEAPQFTVGTGAEPPMLYDYGGFPDFTYHLRYPAPGHPGVAARVAELLGAAGIPAGRDPRRGYDHGTFVPLFVAWPDAAVPVVQMSIKAGFDPVDHLEVGRALAPLRDEGVLIVGSGLSYHNLRRFGPDAAEPSQHFDGWLHQAMEADPTTRTKELIGWEQAPAARICHPREDHLLPLMVALGAAEDEPAVRNYHGSMGGAVASGYRFGALPVR